MICVLYLDKSPLYFRGLKNSHAILNGYVENGDWYFEGILVEKDLMCYAKNSRGKTVNNFIIPVNECYFAILTDKFANYNDAIEAADKLPKTPLTEILIHPLEK